MIKQIESFYNFQCLKLKIASPKQIFKWGYRGFYYGSLPIGQIIFCNNDINLRSRYGSLISNQIFGPVEDWTCDCNKKLPKELRKKLTKYICKNCGVEFTLSKVRRYRMGFINLNWPIVHTWYLNSRPNYLSLLLNKDVKTLQDQIYFVNFNHNEKRLLSLLNKKWNSITSKKVNVTKVRKNSRVSSFNIYLLVFYIYLKLDYKFLYLKRKNLVQDVFHNLGSKKILKVLNKINLLNEIKSRKHNIELNLQLSDSKVQDYNKKLKEIRLLENFYFNKINPTWLFLTKLPVLPIDLRRRVTEDKNFNFDAHTFYLKILQLNKELENINFKLLTFEYYCKNILKLQILIDNLIDNKRKFKNKILEKKFESLKSLTTIISGKTGLFRHNLLGKRVDYSARSIIVVEPKLKFNCCMVPYKIALKLFYPFIIKMFVSYGIENNEQKIIKMIQDKKMKGVIWLILTKLLKIHPIILNRAPTLHKFGIQSFNGILSNKKTISLNPLVCSGFNADFDGDQMAVYLPLSKKSRLESKFILLSSNNLLSTNNGSFILSPSQDIVLGNYYLTKSTILLKQVKVPICLNVEKVTFLYETNIITINSFIWFRLNHKINNMKFILLKKKKINDNLDLYVYNNLQVLKNNNGNVVDQFILITVGNLFLNNIFNYIFKSTRFDKKRYYSSIS